MKNSKFIAVVFVCVFTIGVTAKSYSSGPNFGLRALSELEKSETFGASGFFQTCDDTSDCPGDGTCDGCERWVDVEGNDLGCMGGRSGCIVSPGMEYDTCSWALCVWCWQNGSGTCGTYTSPNCRLGLIGCECDMVQGGASCKKNCT